MFLNEMMKSDHPQHKRRKGHVDLIPIESFLNNLSPAEQEIVEMQGSGQITCQHFDFYLHFSYETYKL